MFNVDMVRLGIQWEYRSPCQFPLLEPPGKPIFTCKNLGFLYHWIGLRMVEGFFLSQTTLYLMVKTNYFQIISYQMFPRFFRFLSSRSLDLLRCFLNFPWTYSQRLWRTGWAKPETCSPIKAKLAEPSHLDLSQTDRFFLFLG